MKIQRMPEDVVPLLNDLIRRITSLESKPLGTVYVNEVIVARDPESGVETVMGDLTEYGENRVGIKQWVNDTEPPAIPTPPHVTISLGVFSLVWDGFFLDDAPMAPDFSHLNVYGNNGTLTKLVGAIKTKDEVAIVTSDSKDIYNDVWSFWFTSVDQNGNESAPSFLSENNQLSPLVQAPDIQEAIEGIKQKIQEDFTKSMEAANGKNRIWHTPEPPALDPKTPFIDGDMWFDTDNGNKIHIWNSTPTPGSWVAATLDSDALDQKVIEAIQDAQDQADKAINTANGKNKAWHSPTAPSGTNHNIGDIWFKTDEDNKIHLWDGSKWEPATSSADSIPQEVLDDILEAKNRADQALSSANGKNRFIDSTSDKPSKTDGYIDGDVWRKWSNLGATGKLLKSWSVKNGSWVEDSMDASYLPKVDIGEGTFGNLHGDRLIANTVSTEKILVGAFDNVIPDPLFTNNASDWLTGTYSMYDFPSGEGRSGGNAFKIIQEGTGQQLGRYSKKIPVEPGDSFKVSAWVKSDVSAPISSFAIFANRYQIGSTTSSNPTIVAKNDSVVPANTWVYLEGVYKVPENSSHMSIGFFKQSVLPASSTWWSDPSAIRMSGATLIEDGAITTTKMKAGSITAESGIIASLDAGKITTGEMDGKFIKGQTILANKLAVMDFTNLLPNLNSQADDWVLSGGTSIINSSLSPEKKRLSFPVTALAQAISPDIGVVVGDKIRIEFNTYATTLSNNLELCWFGRDGVGSSSGSGVLKKTSTNNEKVSVVWEVPDNVSSVRFSIRVPAGTPSNTSVTGAYNISARKMTGAVLIQDGAVEAVHMKTGTITAESGVIASLDASKMTVGELDGKLLKAGTVMATSLAVGSFDNLVPDPSFEAFGASGLGWRDDNSGSVTVVKESGFSRTGEWSLKFESTTARSLNSFYHDTFIPAGIGEYFKAGVHYKVGAGAGSARVRIYEYNEKGGYIRSILGGGDEITLSGWTKSSITHRISDDAVQIRVRIYFTATAENTVIYVDDVYCNRMDAGELIVDGAITANKIAANAIESDKIKANAITADKIEAGAIKAQHIGAKEVTADKMLIGTGENIIPNSQLTSIDGWPGWGRNTNNGPGGQASVWLQGRVNKSTTPFPISGGKKYRFRVDVMAQYEGSRFYVQINTNAGNPYAVSNQTVGTTWNTFSGEVDIPEGATEAYLNVYGNHPNGTSTTGYQWYTNWSLVAMTTGELIVNGSIKSNNIDANAVKSDHIEAKAISVDKLAIGSFDNLIPEPEFTAGGSSWNLIPTVSINPSASSSGGPTLRIVSNNTIQDVLSKTSFPVNGGEQYLVTARVKSSVEIPVSGTNIGIQCKNRSTGGFSYPRIENSSIIPANTWAVISGVVSVPSTTSEIRFFVSSRAVLTTGNLDFEFVSATRASTGELIVDGAIDGKTITGAVIRTSNVPNTGIEINGSGSNNVLRAWDSTTKKQTVNIDGKVNWVSGIFRTSAPGEKGLVLLNNSGNSEPGIWFTLDGSTTVTHAAIFADSEWNLNLRGRQVTSGGSRGAVNVDGGLRIISGGIGNNDQTFIIDQGGNASFSQQVDVGKIRILHGNDVSETSTAHGFQIGSSFADHVRMDTNEFFSLNGTNWSPFYFKGSVLALESKSRAYMTQENGSSIEVGNDSTGTYFKATAADSRTTTRGTNVNMYYGIFYRTTSSAKYKIDPVEIPAEWDDRILSLKATRWFDKNETEAVAEYFRRVQEGESLEGLAPSGKLRRIPGMIAEEVESAGLEDYVIYNEDGEIEGLMYDRLAVSLIPIVRRQKDRIVELENKVSTLEEKLNRLENLVEKLSEGV